ncbi:MAG TPA: nucleoside hydrolase [Bryobacteraceae bacterium]
MRLLFSVFLIGACLCAAAQRPAAPWPPPEGVLRVIIDTDAGAEIDDQYALSLALGSPGRIHLEGIVGAYFGDFGGSSGASQSVAEIERVLAKAGLSGKVPVKTGAPPFVFLDRPPESDGVRFILEKARASSPENPLWVVSLGPATDVAAALSLDPNIADRMIVLWHGRTQWPLRCWNYNVWNDPKAARLLFSLPCRLILFDTGDHLTASMEETGERFAKLGPLGAYLQQIRSKRPGFLLPTKSMFDLGDLTALVDPQAVQWERIEAPAVDYDLRYDFSKKMGKIVRIYYVDRDRAFRDLETALRTLLPSR